MISSGNSGQRRSISAKDSFRPPLPQRSLLAVLLMVLGLEHLLELGLVGPQLGSLGVQRAVVVGIAEQRLDGEQDGAHVVQSRPLVLEYVQADVAVSVDVRMEARRQEFDCGRSERVALGKAQRELVDETAVHLWEFEREQHQRIRTNLIGRLTVP